MIKLLIFLLFTVSLTSYADEEVKTSAPQGPAFGFIGGNSLGGIIGDFNQFGLGADEFDFQRYGGGSSRMQAGNGFGLSLNAETGFFLWNRESSFPFYPRIAVEPVDGDIVVNTNSQIESFYNWNPKAMAGLQIGDGKTVSLMPVVKYGFVLNDLGRYGLLPRYGWSQGWGVYLVIKQFKAGFSLIDVLGLDQRFRYLDTDFNKFMGIRYEMREGFRKEESVMLFLRVLDLWDKIRESR